MSRSLRAGAVAGPASSAEPQRILPREGGTEPCFHCGDPVPARRWVLELDGAPRAFCCAGCLAVAQTIRAAGLADFYQLRTAHAPGPAEGDDEWSQYDVLAESRLATRSGETIEVALLLEGIRCAACVWLNETYVQRLPGVREFRVNFATQRARLVWSAEETRLSTVLRAIAAIGYRAYPYDPARREALVRREGRALLVRTAVALLAMMQVMMFAVPGYVSAEAIEPAYRHLLAWASLLLALPVVLYCAAPFFAGALRDLALRRLGMDVPVALGVGAAFAYSAWRVVVGGAGPVYFDSVTMFVALLLVARYVEFVARRRAGATIEGIARERPETAERLTDYPTSDGAQRIAAARLAPGDVVRVAAGATIPADGVVLDGRSSVEEAILNGESWPRAKALGASVLAGSVNRESPLIVRVTACGEATTAAALSRLVARAAEGRPRVARIADRAAAWFVGALFAIAACAGLAWWALDPSRALEVAFAVLIVSCPCALSLATPAALAACAGALGRRRILAVRPDAIETLSRVTHLVLDKTGTITAGSVRLSAVVPLGELAFERCITIAAALEQGSTHPIAAALRAAAAPDTLASDLVAVPGQGVEGLIDGRRYRCGRPAWAGALHGAATPEEDIAPDAVRVALADESGWLAWLVLSDPPRDGARELVAAARSMGIAVSLVSGDRRTTVEHVGQLAGIEDCHGDAMPEAKRAFIAALQRDGAVVAMVGDGINDAPSLAQADVSLSLGRASALTQWTADVVVLGEDLRDIGVAMKASRRTFRVIRQNLAWALAYNAIAIPLAAAGQLAPLAAAVGMSASSILVVANASRLARLDAADRGGANPSRTAAREGWRWKSSTC